MRKVLQIVLVMVLIGGVTLTNNPFVIEKRGEQYYIDWIGFEESENDNQIVYHQSEDNEKKSTDNYSKKESDKNKKSSSSHKKKATRSSTPSSNNQKNTTSHNASNESSNSSQNIEKNNKPTQSQLDSYGESITSYLFDKVNFVRTNAGFPEFLANSDLTRIANIRGNELVQKYSHDRPNGESVLSMLESYNASGENIAYISRSDFSPTDENIESIANQFASNWTTSSGHYANITHSSFSMQRIKVVVTYEYNDDFQDFSWCFYAANVFAG